LLRWTQDVARQSGKRWLRLDTWDGNRKMRDYYERQGFLDYRGTHKSLYQLEL